MTWVRFFRALRDVGAAAGIVLVFGLDIWGWAGWHPSPVARALPYAVFLIALVGWLWPKTQQGGTLQAGPVDAPLAALLAAIALSAVVSPDPAAAAQSLTFAVLLTLWLKLAQESTFRRPALLPTLLLFASGLVALQAVLEFLRWYAGIGGLPEAGLSWLDVGAGLVPPVHPRIATGRSLSWIPGLASGANAVGGLMAAVCPVALACLLFIKERRLQATAAAWLPLAVLTLFLVDSRAAWLAAGSGCLALLLLLAWHPVLGPRAPAAVKLLAHPAVFAFLAAVPLGGVLFMTVSGRTVSTLERLYVWGGAVRIWVEHLWLGAGPGQYAVAQVAARADGPLADTLVHAHSLWFQLAAVLGVIGLVAAGWLTWRLASAAWTSISGADGPVALIKAGCLGGLVALGVYSLGDLPTPLVAATGAALAGIAVSATGRACSAGALACESATPGHAGFPYRAALAGLPLALLVLFSLDQIGRTRWMDARALAQSGRWDDAAAALQGSGFGHAGLYHQQMGLLHTQAGRWREADANFTAAATAPWSGELLASASLVAGKVGDEGRAFNLAQRASEVAPDDPRPRLLLGDLLQKQGRDRDAARAYGAALALRPEWTGSVFWEAPEGSVRNRRLVVQEAIAWLQEQTERPLPWREARRAELSNRTGQHREAISAAGSSVAARPPATARTVMEEIALVIDGRVANVVARERALFGAASTQLYEVGRARLALGEHQAAWESFQALRQRSPADPRAYQGRAALALARDDPAQAIRDAKTAVLLGGRRDAAGLLGRALLQSGKPLEAIPWLERRAQPDREMREDLVHTLYLRPEVATPLADAWPSLQPDKEIASVRALLERARTAALAATPN